MLSLLLDTFYSPRVNTIQLFRQFSQCDTQVSIIPIGLIMYIH